MQRVRACGPRGVDLASIKFIFGYHHSAKPSEGAEAEGGAEWEGYKGAGLEVYSDK